MAGSNDETVKLSRSVLKTKATPEAPTVGNVAINKKRSVSDIARNLRYNRHVMSPKIKSLSHEIQQTFRDPEGQEEQKMSKNNLKESIRAFRDLSENSPLEAPVAGFNRHLRDMSPVTREIVLRSHMPEIMAFATDRMVSPEIVTGVAEATMRLGRIPDLGMYGLAGDDGLAVKDFLADTILNVAEDEINILNAVLEDDGMSPKAKHLKLASDYKKLAEFHKRRTKEEMDKGKIAKEDGRAHSAIQANAAAEKHKTLAMHCMGLADYHQLTANEHPADAAKLPQYPAESPQKKPAEPPQDAEHEKAPPMKEPKAEGLDSKAGEAMGTAGGAAIGGYFGRPDVGAKLGGMAGKAAGAKNIIKGAKALGSVAAKGMFSESAQRFRAFNAKMEDDPTGAPPLPPKPGTVAKIGGALKNGLVGASQGVGSAAANLASGAGAGAGAALSGVAGGVGSGINNAAKGLATGKINMPKFNSEATTEAGIAAALKPLSSFGPSRTNSILPMIERSPVETKYTRWGGDKEMLKGKKLSGQGYDTDEPGDEAEQPADKRRPMEHVTRFRKAETMESMLAEAKSKKPRRKAKVDPTKAKHILANAKIAPLFYDLGHKMDHAETKVTGKPYGTEWAKKLHDLCLKDGGSVASDAVIKHSLIASWVRDQGFTDEASNLRRNWETSVSKDAQHSAATTEPEPIVFAINNILHMSGK